MKNNIKIFDLHCDLLSYLSSSPNKSPSDSASCCSIPHMLAGDVSHQLLAIFTETQSGSTIEAAKQLQAYRALPKKSGVQFAPAIENASGFFEEEESLDIGFKRLDALIKEAGPIVYMSLTWNSENRFGGGNAAKAGLKKDGERLLDFLNEKNIAIDFSHTSDALAFDILNYIDKKGLSLFPIASHSNFRVILDHPRNLLDEFAKEIFKRKGVIGLNFVRGFIGKTPADFYKHIEHAIQLGGAHQLCFGADFFPEDDIPEELNYLKPFFFSDFCNPSCYPRMQELLAEKMTTEELSRLCHENFFAFLKRSKIEPAFTKE